MEPLKTLPETTSNLPDSVRKSIMQMELMEAKREFVSNAKSEETTLKQYGGTLDYRRSQIMQPILQDVESKRRAYEETAGDSYLKRVEKLMPPEQLAHLKTSLTKAGFTEDDWAKLQPYWEQQERLSKLAEKVARGKNHSPLDKEEAAAFKGLIDKHRRAIDSPGVQLSNFAIEALNNAVDGKVDITGDILEAGRAALENEEALVRRDCPSMIAVCGDRAKEIEANMNYQNDSKIRPEVIYGFTSSGNEASRIVIDTKKLEIHSREPAKAIRLSSKNGELTVEAPGDSSERSSVDMTQSFLDSDTTGNSPDPVKYPSYSRIATEKSTPRCNTLQAELHGVTITTSMQYPQKLDIRDACVNHNTLIKLDGSADIIVGSKSKARIEAKDGVVHRIKASSEQLVNELGYGPLKTTLKDFIFETQEIKNGTLSLIAVSPSGEHCKEIVLRAEGKEIFDSEKKLKEHLKEVHEELINKDKATELAPKVPLPIRDFQNLPNMHVR